jgi:hypothetical protein
MRLWASWIASGLATLFLLVDAAMKLARVQVAVDTTVQLGYPDGVLAPLGVVLLVCTVLYAVPRTSILGGILLTGYLGGAVATHVRVGDPLFSTVLFPVYMGVALWGGLYLRDARLRALMPLRGTEERKPMPAASA